MNQPYVKQLDSNGVCTNPIEKSLINQFPNRQQRRAHKTATRFVKNSKASHLTVIKTDKYLREVQTITHKYIKDKAGMVLKVVRLATPKQIYHYILK